MSIVFKFINIFFDLNIYLYVQINNKYIFLKLEKNNFIV